MLKRAHLNILVESTQPHLHPSLRRIVAVRSTQASCCFQNYTLCIFAFYTNNMVIFRIAPDPTFTSFCLANRVGKDSWDAKNTSIYRICKTGELLFWWLDVI